MITLVKDQPETMERVVDVKGDLASLYDMADELEDRPDYNLYWDGLCQLREIYNSVKNNRTSFIPKFAKELENELSLLNMYTRERIEYTPASSLWADLEDLMYKVGTYAFLCSEATCS